MIERRDGQALACRDERVCACAQDDGHLSRAALVERKEELALEGWRVFTDAPRHDRQALPTRINGGAHGQRRREIGAEREAVDGREPEKLGARRSKGHYDAALPPLAWTNEHRRYRLAPFGEHERG